MSSNQDQRTNRDKQMKKRDTHFLCFPLTSPTSIPQLAQSLAHFRAATTSISQVPRLEQRETSDLDQHDQQLPSTQSARDSWKDPLRIIPEKAHRPPGTYHLTIGVMDLSEQSEMDRALDLLQSLDLQSLLLQARDFPPSSHKFRHNRRQPRTSDNDQPQEHSGEKEAESTSKPESLSRPISPPPSLTHPPASEEPSTSPITISLTGLSAFNSPKQARVFYAKPQDPSQRLHNFGLLLRQHFRDAGFITETRPLVLHATVANMRYAVQAHGGRTSKGRKWARGKERWQQGMIDAREVVRVFDTCGGRVEEARVGSAGSIDEEGGQHSHQDLIPRGKVVEAENGRQMEEGENSGQIQAFSKQEQGNEADEYVWARDVMIDRVAICKMGAEKSDDEVLGLIYPPVGEKKIFSS